MLSTKIFVGILSLLHVATAGLISSPTGATTIVHLAFDANVDGSFVWVNNNSDGSAAEEKGYIKNLGTDDEIQVKEGSYTYYDTDGKLVRVKYIADENGFQILEDTRRQLRQAGIRSDVKLLEAQLIAAIKSYASGMIVAGGGHPL
ncbi:hypothetical protein C8J56DRAFT_1126761 [Mycena floridula]|nr:hypothetical protein C8J56DRAFT_1126761 [Mycena floridula]